MSLKHPIEVTTRDGQTLHFKCSENESLLVGALHHRITLPAICREGACGACRAQCNEGEYELGEHNPGAISEGDKAQGDILLCRTFPRSEMKIHVNQDLETLVTRLPERDAQIIAIEKANDQVIHLKLKLEPDENGDGSASFEAGQYVELAIPGTDVSRAYSMANTPNWDGVLEFYIHLLPEGQFSTWLQQAKVGDKLEARGPEGTFTLDENSLHPRYFVAGGTGLAPILSMLRWMAEMGAMQPAHLYFGVNKEADLFAQKELKTLKAKLPTRQMEICLWKPEGDWDGFTGLPTEALERDLKTALEAGEKPEIYLCGPPALMEATEKLASELGLEPNQIHKEQF